MSLSSAVSRQGVSSLRAANVQSVLDTLRQSGPSSQAGLARATGLAPATITSIVRELRADGRVESHDLNRRERVVSLPAQAGRFAAASIRADSLRVLIADYASGSRTLLTAPAPVEEDSDGPGALADLLHESLERAGLSATDLAGLAVSVQGPVSRNTGAVASWASNNLPAWRGIAVGDVLADRLGLPVVVENDANLAAVAEWTWGAGSGSDVFFYVLSSTHIGGAILLDGEILHGADGLAGEIGHMVVDDSGPMCECGSRGCLSVFASQESILRALRPHAEHSSIRDVVDAARDGDLPSRGLLFDVGRRMGRALADAGKLVAPDTMVLGGDLGRAGSMLLEGLRASIEVTSLRAVSPTVAFRPAELREDEVLLGGVAMLLRREGADASSMPRWLKGS